MNVGTKSVLWGVHQFIWHPICVAKAWRSLYGKWPTWEEGICIFLHDTPGYFGKPNMDGPEGKTHPELGAHVAGRLIYFLRRLFGQSRTDALIIAAGWQSWTARHSTFYATRLGCKPSALYYADKASVLFEPKWFYLLRAKASGEIWEYIDVALKSKVWSYEWRLFFGVQSRSRQARMWLNWYREKTRLRIQKYE